MKHLFCVLALGGLGLCALAACTKSGGAATSDAPPVDAGPPSVEAARVVQKPLDATTHLEAELAPYESVALYARVSGFVQRVAVDRGSKIKQGELLVTIVAPELRAQRAEAEAKMQSDTSTSARLRKAAETPGAVAAQEVEVAEATAKADEERVKSLQSLEQYLNVSAPFDGVVTERNVHPGALVGPQSSDKATPMLRIEQVATLRLTVAVPEGLVGEIADGVTASFTVRAWPAQKFQGITRRIAHSIDPKTRTMAVELDVDNKDGKLAPGMFADVTWPVHRQGPSLFVPASAVVVTTEKTFVERIQDGAIEQVSVQRGMKSGELIEVIGDVHDGDLVAKRGNEELRSGTRVEARESK